MTVERLLFVIAGALVSASTALGSFVSPWWYLFTAFVGLDLFQSGFTDWCPMVWVLEKLGFSVENVVARAREVMEGKGVPGATPHETAPPNTPMG